MIRYFVDFTDDHIEEAPAEEEGGETEIDSCLEAMWPTDGLYVCVYMDMVMIVFVGLDVSTGITISEC